MRIDWRQQALTISTFTSIVRLRSLRLVEALFLPSPSLLSLLFSFLFVVCVVGHLAHLAVLQIDHCLENEHVLLMVAAI